jgi:hypothetical protein
VSPGAANLYIYYRVRSADVSRLIAAVHALHAQWQSELPGLTCTLSQRADAETQLVTLMETYSHPDGLNPHWQRVIDHAAGQSLARWIVGERHLERFVPCA